MTTIGGTAAAGPAPALWIDGPGASGWGGPGWVSGDVGQNVDAALGRLGGVGRANRRPRAGPSRRSAHPVSPDPPDPVLSVWYRADPPGPRSPTAARADVRQLQPPLEVTDRGHPVPIEGNQHGRRARPNRQPGGRHRSTYVRSPHQHRGQGRLQGRTLVFWLSHGPERSGRSRQARRCTPGTGAVEDLAVVPPAPTPPRRHRWQQGRQPRPFLVGEFESSVHGRLLPHQPRPTQTDPPIRETRPSVVHQRLCVLIRYWLAGVCGLILAR
jgi:hypothetical protein